MSGANGTAQNGAELVAAAGLRRLGAQSMRRIVALLPEHRRAPIQKQVEAMGKLPAAELEARIRSLRETEASALRKWAIEERRLQWDRLSPRARLWFSREYLATH